MPYFLNLSQKKHTKKPRVWNINTVKQKLGPEICKNVWFLHAIYGCNTLYAIGRGASLKKFRSSEHFREQAEVFCTLSATPKDIIAAGEQALVTLYNVKQGETMDCLRYKCFFEKVATNATFLLHLLL